MKTAGFLAFFLFILLFSMKFKPEILPTSSPRALSNWRKTCNMRAEAASPRMINYAFYHIQL